MAVILKSDGVTVVGATDAFTERSMGFRFTLASAV